MCQGVFCGRMLKKRKNKSKRLFLLNLFEKRAKLRWFL